MPILKPIYMSSFMPMISLPFFDFTLRLILDEAFSSFISIILILNTAYRAPTRTVAAAHAGSAATKGRALSVGASHGAEPIAAD